MNAFLIIPVDSPVNLVLVFTKVLGLTFLPLELLIILLHPAFKYWIFFKKYEAIYEKSS